VQKKSAQSREAAKIIKRKGCQVTDKALCVQGIKKWISSKREKKKKKKKEKNPQDGTTGAEHLLCRNKHQVETGCIRTI